MWSWWLPSGWRLQLWLSLLKPGVQPVAGDDHHDCLFHSWKQWQYQRQFTTVFFHALFYSTLIPMFTVFDPLLEFTYHLLFSWRKFALCIQSLLCMLFLFGWPPCQRSDMILMEVSQHAYDMIHYISGLLGYFSVCAIYVNLIWYLYLFMLNKFCLSLSLSLSLSPSLYTRGPIPMGAWVQPSITNNHHLWSLHKGNLWRSPQHTLQIDLMSNTHVWTTSKFFCLEGLWYFLTLYD